MSKNPEIKITVLEHQMQEIKKEVTELRKETKKGLATINKKLDCYVPRIEYNKDMKVINEQLNKNSGTWDWVIKTIMALVIAALVGGILVK
jgi:nucleoside-triphosphatase THEP1